MTVAELIEQLQKMPQNGKVIIVTNAGGDTPTYNCVHQISSNEDHEPNRDELMVWIEGLTL